jgi:hypothetical protein
LFSLGFDDSRSAKMRENDHFQSGIRGSCLQVSKAYSVTSSLRGAIPVDSSRRDSTTLQCVLESFMGSDALVAFVHIPNNESRIHGFFPTHFPIHSPTQENSVCRAGGFRIDDIRPRKAPKRIVFDVWPSPDRVRRGQFSLFLQICCHRALLEGLVLELPSTLRRPSVPIRTRRLRIPRGELGQRGGCFYDVLCRFDTQTAWDVLNTLIDKFLQHRAGQLKLPPKGDFKGYDYAYFFSP